MQSIGQSREQRADAGGWFACAYFLLAAFSFNSLTAGRPWMAWAIRGVALAGCLLLLWEACHWKRFRGLPLGILLPAFWLSYGLAAWSTREYGLVENGEAMLWMALQFALVYGLSWRENGAGGTVRFCRLVAVYAAGQAGIGLAMLAVDYSGADAARGVYIGIQEGRLWGAYSDPNYGAILSVVAILCALYLMEQGEKRRGLWMAGAVLCYLHLVFSYSRSGQVCLAVAAVLAFGCFQRRIPGRSRKLLAAVLLFLALVPAFPLLRQGYNWLHPPVYAAEEMGTGTAGAAAEAGTEAGEIPAGTEGAAQESGVLHREEGLSEDFSNGRFAIWQDGLAIWREHPVLGISYRNVVPYMEENMPDAYMVTRENILNTFHNVLVDVTVSQGTLGLVLFLAAAALAVRCLVRQVRGGRDGEEPDAFRRLFPGLVVITVAVGAMFVSDILYVNTPTAVAFWFFLGRLMAGDRAVLMKKSLSKQ